MSSYLSDFQIKSLETAYHDYLCKTKGLDFLKEMSDIEKKYDRRQKSSPKRKKRSPSPPPLRREEGEIQLTFRAHLYFPRKMNTDDVKAWLALIKCGHGLIEFEMSKSYTHANLFIEKREDYDIIMRSNSIEDVKVFKYKR